LTDGEREAKVRALRREGEQARAMGRDAIVGLVNDELRALDADPLPTPRRVERTAQSGAAAARRTTAGKRQARKKGD
jgi:hypothetical protein